MMMEYVNQENSKYEKGCDGFYMTENKYVNKGNCYYGFALEQGGRCTHQK